MSSLQSVDRRDVNEVMKLYGFKSSGSGWTDGERSIGTGHGLKKEIHISSLRSIADQLQNAGYVQRQEFMTALRDPKAAKAKAREKVKTARSNGGSPEPAPIEAQIVTPKNSTPYSKLLKHPKVGEVKVSIVEITPANARVLLKRHEESQAPQRRIAMRTVNKLVHAIEDGQWGFNAETIVIGQTGGIVNGRHRLMACDRADKSIITLLVEELPNERDAFDISDQHRPRTVRDILVVHDMDEAGLSAVVRLIYAHYSGT